MVAMPEWFRTEQGLVRLIVVKQFNFTFKRQPPRRFAVGEHLLDPKKPEDAEILAHEWICEQFADGHIESPQKTRERLEAVVAASGGMLGRAP
jgi:hypothetical protein